jgi:TolA-binding protein
VSSTSRLIAGWLVALSSTGCFATKGDVRLLQEELRATRASVARSDSAHRRTSDSLAAALANLSSVQTSNGRDAAQARQKLADDVKALAARVSASDIATREQLKSLNDDLDQVREIARQNARGQALARAQLEQARPPAPVTPDSTAAPGPPAGTPSSATLLVTGRSLILNNSCSTARRAFQDVVTQYPDSPEAPEAQYLIAESYISCGEGGNPAKADSVYKVVIEKYPRSDFAATSLYKRAEALRLAGKIPDARPLYEKIVCEYPRSTVLNQALNRLGGQRPTTCR